MRSKIALSDKNILDNAAICVKVYSNKDVSIVSNKASISKDRGYLFFGEDAQTTKMYMKSPSFSVVF